MDEIWKVMGDDELGLIPHSEETLRAWEENQPILLLFYIKLSPPVQYEIQDPDLKAISEKSDIEEDFFKLLALPNANTKTVKALFDLWESTIPKEMPLDDYLSRVNRQDFHWRELFQLNEGTDFIYWYGDLDLNPDYKPLAMQLESYQWILEGMTEEDFDQGPPGFSDRFKSILDELKAEFGDNWYTQRLLVQPEAIRYAAPVNELGVARNARGRRFFGWLSLSPDDIEAGVKSFLTKGELPDRMKPHLFQFEDAVYKVFASEFILCSSELIAQALRNLLESKDEVMYRLLRRIARDPDLGYVFLGYQGDGYQTTFDVKGGLKDSIIAAQNQATYGDARQQAGWMGVSMCFALIFFILDMSWMLVALGFAYMFATDVLLIMADIKNQRLKFPLIRDAGSEKSLNLLSKNSERALSECLKNNGLADMGSVREKKNMFF